MGKTRHACVPVKFIGGQVKKTKKMRRTKRKTASVKGRKRKTTRTKGKKRRRS